MSKIKLTILGCGTCVPLKEKNPAGFLLEIGDRLILLDAGYGTIRRMLDLGFDVQDIDLAFASHFHPDHFADFFNLIFARFGNAKGLRKPETTLKLMGPRGLEDNFLKWRQIYWHEWDANNETYPVEFFEGERVLEMAKIKLQTFSVFHVKWMKALGIAIEFEGKKIVYTGDIGQETDFVNAAKTARNADLLICEASLKNSSCSIFTLENAKKFGEKADVKKILIIHVFPENEEKARAFCQKEKKFILGRDTETIEV